MKKIILLASIIALASLSSCDQGTKGSRADQNGTDEINKDVESDWIYLFNGTSTDGWRGFNQEALPENWIIEDGTLKSLSSGGGEGAGIVYGAEEFDNFELSLEWKLSKGGNSGIFYHVLEGEQYKYPSENAPEYQVIDDIDFPYELGAWQSVGGDYDMYDPDPDKIVKKWGEWNTSRIVFTPEKVQYWLNGKMTVEFVPWTSDWQARKMDGKWKDYPDYGVASSGLISIQDHGSSLWFRNIKIRKL